MQIHANHISQILKNSIDGGGILIHAKHGGHISVFISEQHMRSSQLLSFSGMAFKSHQMIVLIGQFLDGLAHAFIQRASCLSAGHIPICNITEFHFLQIMNRNFSIASHYLGKTFCDIGQHINSFFLCHIIYLSSSLAVAICK